MNHIYNIGGINIDIWSDSYYLKNRMEPFRIYNSDNVDFYVKMEESNLLLIEGETIMQDDGVGWMRKDDSYVSYSRIQNSGDILSVLKVDKNWKNATVLYTKETGYSLKGVDYGDFNGFHMVGVMFRYGIIQHGGIVVHASSIEINGEGIIFTAPAGTGKSTHVKLWEKYLGDRINIINDDTPVLKPKGTKTYLYGTPWSGSSDKFMNKHVPLKAIVIIERASQNSIYQISRNEATIRLMPRFFFPYFEQSFMGKAVNIFEKVLSQTSVYLLKCKPEKEAMELVYDILEGR